MSDNMRKRARLHREMATNMLSMKDLEGEEDDPVTMFARAKLLEKDSKYEDAIEEYKRALEIDPDFVNAVYSKAACESQLGRFEDAINTYNQAFLKDMNDNESQNNFLNSMPKSKLQSPLKPRDSFIQSNRGYVPIQV